MLEIQRTHAGCNNGDTTNKNRRSSNELKTNEMKKKKTIGRNFYNFQRRELHYQKDSDLYP